MAGYKKNYMLKTLTMVSLLMLDTTYCTQLYYDEFNTHSILEEQPVTLNPPDVTCRPSTPGGQAQLTYYPPEFSYSYSGNGEYENEYFETIYCNTTCPKRYPQQYEKTQIVGEQARRLGDPGCSEVPAMLRVQSPTSITNPGSTGATGSTGLTGAPRSRRVVDSVCALEVDSTQGVGSKGRTYTLWVNPDEQHSNGTILSSAAGGPVLSGGFDLNLQGTTLELRSGYRYKRYSQYQLPKAVWTHIGLQATEADLGEVQAVIAVYLNGTLLDGPLTLYSQVPSRKRRAAQDGGGSVADPVFLGVSARPYYTGYQCKLSTVEFCQRAGQSVYVHTTQPLETIENRAIETRQFVKNACPQLASRIRDVFTCATFLPGCLWHGEKTLPCRSLCQEFNRQCNSTIQALSDCSMLPQSRCIGKDTFPDYGYFRGSVKKAQVHEDLLSQREIQEIHTGTLPVLDPVSDCLCPHPSLGVATNLMCSVPEFSQRRVHRLGQSYKVPEAINDKPWPNYYDRHTTDWFSKENVSSVTFTIAFSGRKLIHNISVILPRSVQGAFADVTTIQLKAGNQWKTIGYIGSNCSALSSSGLAYSIEQELGVSMTAPVCTQIDPYSTEVSMRLIDPGYKRSGVDFTQRQLQIHPTVKDYFSGTSLHLIMRGHQNPKNRFFALADVAAHGWSVSEEVCECFNGGLALGISPNNPCDGNNRCRCKNNSGDPAETQFTCTPYVLSDGKGVIPNYGPESGGTEIIISGGFFGTSNVSVMAGLVEFTVLKVQETVIRCISPNVTERPEIRLYEPQTLRLVLHRGTAFEYTLILDEAFVFMEDPIIESISPLSTFLRGGINQTVVGQHLDSVFAPFVQVTVVYKNAITYPQNITLCRVTNSTEMVCPSPEIFNLPPELLNQLPTSDSRQKRQIGNDQHALEFSEHEIPTRTRRQLSGNSINSDDLQFYLGFKLDGVKAYDNVSETLPKYGIIKVFTDPDPEPWTDANQLRVFEVYKGDEFIQIKGERMNFGCELKDYEVKIGDGICLMVDLFSTSLQCRPPSSEPPTSVQVLNFKGSPSVTVKVGNIYELIGYLDYHETAWDNPSVRGAVITVIVIIVIAAIIAAIVVVILRRRKQQKMREKEAAELSMKEVSLWSSLPDEMRTELEPCLKSNESLKLGTKVGEGNFGTVYVGRYNDDKGKAQLVAAKTIKGSDLKELTEFLEEATLMKDFHHENVLGLVGVVLQEGRPYVLLPLMENGDLRTYLLKPDNKFIVKDLIDYGHQVAKGMTYLSGLKFVHRDLAARNCMISKDNVVRVADFGLARDIYSNEYYRVENKSRPLPIKWMAPEALDDHKFTCKSDVWSYAVLLWELLTRGKRPYADVDNYELKKFLVCGNRLQKPSVAPDNVYELMLQCWNMNPSNRPEFKHIEKELADVLQEEDDQNADEPSSPGEEDKEGRPSYEALYQSVDYTTDRQGYEELHAEQGYLDMQNNINYQQVAEELGIYNDGYLAPVEASSSKSTPSSTHKLMPKAKPVPAPRTGAAKRAPKYQNMSAIQSQLLAEDKAKSHQQPDIKLGNIKVDVVAPNERDSDIPVYISPDNEDNAYLNMENV